MYPQHVPWHFDARRRQEAREDAQCTAAAVIRPDNEEARLADQSHAGGTRLARRDDRLGPPLHVDPPIVITACTS